jgi:hypothetical protein
MARLQGDVLAHNQPMLELVKKLGFNLKKTDDPQVVKAEMGL